MPPSSIRGATRTWRGRPSDGHFTPSSQQVRWPSLQSVARAGVVLILVADQPNLRPLQNDPTFQGLLASLRRAQDTTLNEPTTPASAVGPWDTPVLTHGTNSVGQGSYTVPYELPPAVEGVFPTYASLEQARHGPDPADSRVQALADSYSPVSSALPTSLSVSIHSAAHQDPFATTSGGGQKPKDLRLLTFTQALPYLTRLVEDPSFLDVMRQVRQSELFIACL